MPPRRAGARQTTRKRSSGSHYDYRHSGLKNLLKWLFVAGLWVGMAGLAVVAWYASELPDITRETAFERRSSIVVKAADGSVVARYGEMKGESIGIKDIPEDLVHAVLAIEDRRFYSHFGLDPFGLARAILTNLVRGGVVQGGSTITQQLAKNLFLTQERTFKRKAQEALLALWLEHELSKDEILSAYLNRVYLGSGTYGVAAASKLYFGKDVRKVTLRESAMLAGLLKAPSRYSPLNSRELANKRADTVLKAMEDAGYITDKQRKGSKPKDEQPTTTASADSGRYFTDWVVDGLDELVGNTPKDLVVQTTLDPVIQKRAEAALARVLKEHGAEKRISQGAVIIMRRDGGVVALVGGADYRASQFNRVTQAKRQPGSSFKPFVFLSALEHGMTRQSIVLDAPFTEGRYRPENFGNNYYGEVPLETALAFSLNTATVRLVKMVGPEAVANTARRLGIISNLERDLTLGLGSSSVSPLELSTAYAALSNGGLATFPYAIRNVKAEDGTMFFQRSNSGIGQRVADANAVATLAMMMQSVIQYGTGQRAKVPFAAAGKTGTSQNSKDAWFAGFTDELVGVVWLGNDDNAPMKNVTGGSYPAEIWRESIMAGQGRHPPPAIAQYDTGNYDDRNMPPMPQSQGMTFERLLQSIVPPSPAQRERAPAGDYAPPPQPAERKPAYNN